MNMHTFVSEEACQCHQYGQKNDVKRYRVKGKQADQTDGFGQVIAIVMFKATAPRELYLPYFLNTCKH